MSRFGSRCQTPVCQRVACAPCLAATTGALLSMMPVGAGQMSLHHTDLVHASGANQSDDRRSGWRPHCRRWPISSMRASKHPPIIKKIDKHE